MPYIITVKQRGRNVIPRVGRTMDILSCRAVATLDEARDWAEDRVYIICGAEGASADDKHVFGAVARGLPESGGTITLPDGTVIKVERVARWLDLERAYRNEPDYPGSIWPTNVANDPRDRKGGGFDSETVEKARAEIIAAYNEAQKGRES